MVVCGPPLRVATDPWKACSRQIKDRVGVIASWTMARAYHTTSDPIHELPRKAYDCRRKAIVLADDSGSVMQPHVPDRLDPWGLGLLELIVLRVRWIVYPHSFLAQESRKVPEGKFICRCGGPRAADALPLSRLMWVQMYNILCRVYDLYV